MAGSRTMDVSVIVKLVDQLTGPINAVIKKFDRLTQAVRQVGTRLGEVGRRFGVFAAAAAAISFAAPIASAAEFDQKLRDGVVTAGFFGKEAQDQINSLRGFYHELAVQSGLTSASLADAGNLLVASGLDAHLSRQLLPTIARVSKAASAVPEDVANVAFALTNSMGIASDKMEENLAKLVVAGNLGRFEFKDMARYIPTLAAEFEKFGMKGTKAVETMAASLQVAMFGTSDTSAAANNFKNYLSKLLAPETVKRFEGFGVNIAGVMQNAAARGLDPIEASYQKVLQLTGLSQKKMLDIFNANKGKGMNDAEATAAALEQIKKIAGAGKLGTLFGDMEVLNFILPMMANIEKYKEFKKEIANAGLDVIAKDYATQWEGLSTQLAIAGEIGKQAVDRIGLAFAKNLPFLNQWGIKALGWLRDMDAAYPGVIDQVLSWGAAILGAVAALALLVPVLSFVGAGLGLLVPLGGALLALLGALLTPIGAVVAALAAGAVIIYANWNEFSAYFRQMWAGLKGMAGGIVQYLGALFRGDWGGMLGGLRRLWAGVKSMASGISNVFLSLNGHILRSLKSAAGKAVDWLDAQLGTDIRSWPGKVIATLEDGFKLGGAVLKNIWDTNLTKVKEAFDNLKGWIDGWTNGGFSAALNAAGEKWNVLKTKAADAFEGIKSAWRSLVSFVEGLIPSFNWPDPLQWLQKLYNTPSPNGGSQSGSETPPTDAMGNPTGPAPAPSGSTGGTFELPSWLQNRPAAPQRQGFAPVPTRFASISTMQPVGRANIAGQIVVSAAPGAKVEKAVSDNPSVALRVDNGRMVGRV